MKTGDLHLHCLDRFDSQNEPERVCKRLKELGAKGFALTQHGMMSAVDRMREAAEKYGLKFIPGVEAYFQDPEDIQKRHLILLARDNTGYMAISKAVTRSNDKDGYAVMNTEILKRFFGPGTEGHGHVIATSACIQGVIAMHLRKNEEVDHAIEKLQRKEERLEFMEDITFLGSVQNRIEQITERVKSEKRKQTDEEKEELSTLRKQKKDYETRKEKHQILMQELEELVSKKKSGAELITSAEEETKKFRELFGADDKGEPCFYMEVQNHGIETERNVYPLLTEIAHKCNVPLVATNDVHIVDKTEEEVLRRQILKALRFQEWSEVEPGDRELHIKTDEELREWLQKILMTEDVDEAMSNIGRIIDRCNVTFKKESHYPKFPSGDNSTSNEVLEREIERGIRWRYPEGMDEAHKEQLRHELKVIESMGYADYHLIVKDFLEYGRLLGSVPDDKINEVPLSIEGVKRWLQENDCTIGFTIGPGRGSAVGSLVCYLLGITSLDPMKYGLLFERFLNPERVSMPDIDSDISQTVRSKVIEYVTAKYGKDAVCGIMTMNAQAPRGAVRIAAKYYCQSINGNEKLYLSIADAIAKSIPLEPGTRFSTVLDPDTGETVLQQLKKKFTKKEEREIIRWATIIEGCFTAYGAHAAGVIISDNNDVSEYVPLRWNKDLNEWTSQCDMVQAEEVHGLLKMDFLGLKTLDIITGCQRLIRENHGVSIDPLNIPLDDKDVYRDIFSKGRTNSVFQFESSGMKTMLKRFKPESFEDLIILVSMFRPGPLQYLDGVVEVKNGKEPEYLCDELIPILGKTYGAIVYQEQVMEIFQRLAGYTLGGADLVRRFMSKKKQDKLAHERVAFVDGDAERNIKGCVANGIQREAADRLFDQMTEFAKYAFNKSHAAAYAYNAYVTGWLKYHYPAEFLASAMAWADSKKIPGLMQEAKTFGITVKVPDVNSAGSTFTVENNCICFGMGSIRSVGKTGDTILRERMEHGKFVSIKDFLIRTKVSRTVYSNLCKAGAFDCFSTNRRALNLVYEDLSKAVEKVGKKQAIYDKSVSEGKTEKAEKDKIILKEVKKELDSIMIPVDIPEDMQEKLKDEKYYLGAFVTAHPMDEYPDAEMASVTAVADIQRNGFYEISGAVTEIEIKHRKKDGKPMAFVKVEDKTGEIMCNFFTNAYEKYGKYLQEGNVLTISGDITLEESEEDDEVLPVMMVEMAYPSAKAKKQYMLTVSSYAVFHESYENEFHEKYAERNGHKLYIYDEALNEKRLAKYRVSEKVSELKEVFVV